jgi:ribonuclease-3
MIPSLEKRLEHSFQKPELLKLALTHASWGHEQNKRLPHNERLEFLGDAVLELVTSEYLFQKFPDLPEGKLTKMRSHLVNRSALVEMAHFLKLGEELILGEAEAGHGGRERESNLANAVEAIIGAIFIDAGYEGVRHFIIRQIEPRLQKLTDNPEPHNVKGLLQEKLHASGEQAIYRIVTEKGPPHEKEFHASVEIRGKIYGSGIGRTKKDAETQAAAAAIEKLMEESKSAA